MKKTIFAIVAILILASCDNTNKTQDKTYTYECVDKKEAVGSHYNFLTSKQVIGSEYYIILKDQNTGKIVTHEVSLREYYQYNVGDSYTFNYELY